MVETLVSERVIQLGRILCLFDISIDWIFSFNRNAGVRVACGLIKLSSHGLNIQPTVSVLFLTMITALLMVFY